MSTEPTLAEQDAWLERQRRYASCEGSRIADVIEAVINRLRAIPREPVDDGAINPIGRAGLNAHFKDAIERRDAVAREQAVDKGQQLILRKQLELAAQFLDRNDCHVMGESVRKAIADLSLAESCEKMWETIAVRERDLKYDAISALSQSSEPPSNEFTKGGGLSFEGAMRADDRGNRATEETGNDRPAAPISLSADTSRECKLPTCEADPDVCQCAECAARRRDTSRERVEVTKPDPVAADYRLRMTGNQLLGAVAFCDSEKDVEVLISYLEPHPDAETGEPREGGLYISMVDYPDEGSVFLPPYDDAPAAAPVEMEREMRGCR